MPCKRYAERKNAIHRTDFQLMAQGLLEHTTLAEIAEIAHKWPERRECSATRALAIRRMTQISAVRAQIETLLAPTQFETIDTAFSTLKRQLKASIGTNNLRRDDGGGRICPGYTHRRRYYYWG
jgi:D-arabinose 5-phosphate isomerase GutQ